MAVNLEEAFRLVQEEICYAEDKHGKEPFHSDDVWLRILVEEVGECARDIHEGKSINTLLHEVVQVAAVAVRYAGELTYKIRNGRDN